MKERGGVGGGEEFIGQRSGVGGYAKKERGRIAGSQLPTSRTPAEAGLPSVRALDEGARGLAKVDGGEERAVRDEHRPEVRGSREHHEITHPPENHLQSGRGGVSTGPWGRSGTRGRRARRGENGHSIRAARTRHAGRERKREERRGGGRREGRRRERGRTHHWLLSWSIQCTTNRRRRRGERMGSSLAFS